MKLTPLKKLEFNTTNIPEDTTPLWDAVHDYSESTVRRYGNKLYSPYNDIAPLCEYIYDNTDLLKPHNTITAIDRKEVQDSTAVYCVQGYTVVYVVDNNTYYLYNSTTGDVDFTIEDLTSPSNFTELDSIATPYRHNVYVPDESPIIWEDLGYTNKYKCIDSSLSSVTEFNGDMEMSFIVDKVNKVYLFNLYASEVIISIKDLSTNEIVSEDKFTTYSKDGGSWFNYFFNDFVYTTKGNTDVPIGYNTEIIITIKSIGGKSSLGLVAVGKTEYFGGTLYGAGIGIIDFSEKQVNSAGETYLNQGNFKATNSLTVDVPSSSTDRAVEILTRYRSIPVVFEGTKDFKSTVVFGIYNKFTTLLSTPSISKLSIDIESLT